MKRTKLRNLVQGDMTVEYKNKSRSLISFSEGVQLYEVAKPGAQELNAWSIS